MTYIKTSLEDETGTYVPADADENLEPNTNVNKTKNLPYMNTDPVNKLLEHENTSNAKGHSKAAELEQFQESDITNSVVNTIQSAVVGANYIRPAQFQVAESGETYAVVDQKSTL